MSFYFKEFLEEISLVKSYSRNTLMSYKKDLKLYEEFKRSSFEFFYEFLNSLKLSPRSQARAISCVRSYLKFCQSKGLKSDYDERLEIPKFQKNLPYALSVLDFSNLIQASSEKCPHKTRRNHLILKILFGCGLRVSELVNLNVKDYHETNSCLVVLGKGQKERLVPLTEVIEEDLREYMRESLERLSSSPQALIVNNKKRRLHRVDLWRWIRKWSRDAGLSQKITPHKFRHGCATILLENGADLRTIQALLGHSHIQTTEIYTHVTQNQLSQEIEEHHPLSKIKIS